MLDQRHTWRPRRGGAHRGLTGHSEQTITVSPVPDTAAPEVDPPVDPEKAAVHAPEVRSAHEFRKVSSTWACAGSGEPEPDKDATGDYGLAVARLHDDESEVGPLTPAENKRLLRIRLFGSMGSVLVLVGSLGTGALPVLQNPLAGMRVLSLPSRMWPTALTFSLTGVVILVLAWLLLGKFAVGTPGRRGHERPLTPATNDPQPGRSHAAGLDHAVRTGTTDAQQRRLFLSRPE